MQPVPYRLVDQSCRYRGIYTTTQRHDHFPIPNLLLQRSHRITHKMRRRPVLMTAADVYKEIPNDLLALDTMIDFRMELQTIQRLLRHRRSILLKSSIRNALRIRQHLKFPWKIQYRVGMTHPPLGKLRDIL